MRDLEAGPAQSHLTDHADVRDLETGPAQSHLTDHADVRDLEAGPAQSHLTYHTNTEDLEAGPDQGLSVGISNRVPIPESLNTRLYLTLLHSTSTLLSSNGLTRLYYTLPLLYLALLHST